MQKDYEMLPEDAVDYVLGDDDLCRDFLCEWLDISNRKDEVATEDAASLLDDLIKLDGYQQREADERGLQYHRYWTDAVYKWCQRKGLEGKVLEWRQSSFMP